MKTYHKKTLKYKWKHKATHKQVVPLLDDNNKTELGVYGSKREEVLWLLHEAELSSFCATELRVFNELELPDNSL